MKRVVLIVTLLGWAAGTASAATISYTTAGTFSCGSILSGCSVLNSGTTLQLSSAGGTATLVYVPGGATNTDTPSNANYGNLVASSTVTTPGLSFTGATLLITVTQTSPNIPG